MLLEAALGVAGLVVALYLAAGAAATAPALWQGGFVAGGAPGLGEAAPGDHLQSGYRLWLVGSSSSTQRRLSERP